MSITGIHKRFGIPKLIKLDEGGAFISKEYK